MVYDTFELVDTCTAVKQLLGRWNKMIDLILCWTLTRIALSQSYCWDRIWFGIEHSGRNPLLVICVAAVGQVKQGLVTRVAGAEGRS